MTANRQLRCRVESLHDSPALWIYVLYTICFLSTSAAFDLRSSRLGPGPGMSASWRYLFPLAFSIWLWLGLRKRAGHDRYLELIRAFPLRPLRSREELDGAIGVIDALIVRGDLDTGERDYLDVLSVLVERYEDREHPMPAVSDAAMLRHLLEARGVTLLTFAQETGIAEATVSELVTGQRPLTPPLRDTLAGYFGVSPRVFGGAGPFGEPKRSNLRPGDDAPSGVAD